MEDLRFMIEELHRRRSNLKNTITRENKMKIKINNSHVKHFLFSFFAGILGAAIFPDQRYSLLYIPVPVAWEIMEYKQLEPSQTSGMTESTLKGYTSAQKLETILDLTASYLGFGFGYLIGYLLRSNK